MDCRSSVQESIGCSPNLLRENYSPIDLIIGNPLGNLNPVCLVEYVEWLRNTLENTHEFVHENLKHAGAKQKKYYDHRKRRTFKEGNFVWRWYPPTAGIKLGLGWIGPYKVITKITDVTNKIQKTPE